MAENRWCILKFHKFSFKKGGQEYNAAWKAMDTYMFMTPSALRAHKMRLAVESASLHFDRHTGEIVLNVPRRHLVGLVKKEIIKQLADKATGKMQEIVFGKAFTESSKRIIGSVGISKTLLDSKKRIGNERP